MHVFSNQSAQVEAKPNGDSASVLSLGTFLEIVGRSALNASTGVPNGISGINDNAEDRDLALAKWRYGLRRALNHPLGFELTFNTTFLTPPPPGEESVFESRKEQLRRKRAAVRLKHAPPTTDRIHLHKAAPSGPRKRGHRHISQLPIAVGCMYRLPSVVGAVTSPGSSEDSGAMVEAPAEITHGE